MTAFCRLTFPNAHYARAVLIVIPVISVAATRSR
jgi:hypothetical protein